MTENQKHLFNIDIDEYRKHVLKKYGIPIHIIFSIDAEKTEKVERLTFNAIQKSILEIMKIYNPEFIKHWRSNLHQEFLNLQYIIIFLHFFVKTQVIHTLV